MIDVDPIWKQPTEKKPRRRVNPIGKRSRLRDDVWKTNRAARLEMAHGQCEFDEVPDGHWGPDGRPVPPYRKCYINSGLHVHHRKPTGRGGSHDIDNLMVLCEYHHGYVHQHPDKARMRGWTR